MKKVTVIGGSGFIGTALCRQLEAMSVPFRILDLKLSQTFPDKTDIADIRDKKAMRNYLQGELVVNLAAIHRDDISDPSAYYKTNVDGARVLTEVAKEKGVRRIVFTSSVAVYGFAPIGTDENGEIKPFNDYGKSKFQAEEIFREWHNQSPKTNSLAIVRPTVVFGEGNRGNVYNLLKQIAAGHFIMIGDLNNKKSMAYVENIAEFIKNLTFSENGYMLFNYLDTPDFTMNELVMFVQQQLFSKKNIGLRLPYCVGLSAGYLADFFASVTSVKLPISSIRVKKFCADTSFSSAKADLSSFCPSFTLEEGLQKTIVADLIEDNQKKEFFYTE